MMTKEEIFNQVERRRQDLIDDVCTMIHIDSQRKESQLGMPFGNGVDEALQKALKICQREGLKIGNTDGYMGYGQWGIGENHIGIMGHLDVVDIGEGWDDPAFSAAIHDGRIWGRGALDNKGPLFAAFYGMLALKDLGIIPNIPVRVIFGTNEETGMKDCVYYLQHEKAPLMGFTPDNKFPAVYGKKGRAVFEVSGAIDRVVKFANDYLLNARSNGDRLGIAYKDSRFGEMQIRTKTLFQTKDGIGIRFALSYPDCDINDVTAKISSAANGLKTVLAEDSPVLAHDPDSWFVQTVNHAYEEATDTKAEPTTTSGGTYMNVCPTIINYGPSFPGQNGIAHQPNEWMDIEDLVKCTKIYAWTLYKLCMSESDIDPWEKA
jgi:succinyl-diaminopimelate desuccinylase